MPSKVVTADTTPQIVAAEVRNGRHHPESMTVDNLNGAADKIITIQDEFTPNISHGVAAPTLQTINRHQVTVAAGAILTFDKKDLEGVKCLGTLQILADAIDAACIISVGYRTD